MMTVEDVFDKIRAIVGDVTGLTDRPERIEIPFHVHEPAFIKPHLFLSKMRLEQPGITDHRRPPADDGFVRTEEIKKRRPDNKTKSQEKPGDEPENGGGRQ